MCSLVFMSMRVRHCLDPLVLTVGRKTVSLMDFPDFVLTSPIKYLPHSTFIN